MSSEKVPVTHRLSRYIVEAVARVARDKGVSRTDVLEMAAREYVEREDAKRAARGQGAGEGQ